MNIGENMLKGVAQGCVRIKRLKTWPNVTILDLLFI